MEKDTLAAPVVKWAGGKRQLLDALIPRIPAGFSVYCEPFLGGGAVLFSLQPARAVVNDLNDELINVYKVIRDDTDALISELQGFRNDAESFYQVRAWDRDWDVYQRLSPAKRAARILYLNKTCYNGLFRVNSAGEFNTPFGRYKNPNIVNEKTLKAVSAYFNRADIAFSCGNFDSVLEGLPADAFVYLDPPYDPVSETANFTSYAKDGFGKDEQIRLREACDRLTGRGIRFMLSNSATPFILDQYRHYTIERVQAKRALNSISSRRGSVDEVIVRNYGG